MKLHEKKCIPCSGEIPPISLEEAQNYLKQISSNWSLDEQNMRLWLRLSFKDFKTPLDLVNLIGKLAEDQWHHPELILGYGKLEIGIWTHKINGLVESDFIFASKVDQIIAEFMPNE